MKQKTMRTLKVSIYALICTAFIFGASVKTKAQPFNVNGVEYELTRAIPDISLCLDLIEKAAEHPKTKNASKMHYFRGLTYLKVATEYPDIAVEHPDAMDVALNSFNKAIETDSKNKWTEKSKGHLLNVAIGFYNIGFSAYEARDYANAIDAFDKAVPLMKYDVDGDLRRANLTEEVLVQMIAHSALGMDNNDLAMKNFSKLVDMGYDDPNVYTGLAQLQLISGDTTTALETIAAGRELYELDKTLINLELDLYLKLGRSQELVNKLDAAIEQDPANTIYYFARAISYEALDKVNKDEAVDYLDLAAADYDKIMELDPEYYDAFYNKGVMYINKVTELVDEINKLGIYDPKEVSKYEAKINANYAKAIGNFEYVFENNDMMGEAERMELAKTMKKIYARLSRMDDFNRMKQWIADNE